MRPEAYNVKSQPNVPIITLFRVNLKTVLNKITCTFGVTNPYSVIILIEGMFKERLL